jgi:hypothetical protein
MEAKALQIMQREWNAMWRTLRIRLKPNPIVIEDL